MESVKIKAQTESLTREKVWDLLIDIEKYPERVKFVKKIEIHGVGKGSKWDDTTTILWLPLTMHHTVKNFVKNEEYSFSLPIWGGGSMEQAYTIKEEGKKVIVEAVVNFTLGHEIFNLTIGKILKARLKEMLISAVLSVGGEKCQIV